MDPEIQVTKKIKAKTHLSSVWPTFTCSLREITHFCHEESTWESIFSKHGILYRTKLRRRQEIREPWPHSGVLTSSAVDYRNRFLLFALSSHIAKPAYLMLGRPFSWLFLVCLLFIPVAWAAKPMLFLPVPPIL